MTHHGMGTLTHWPYTVNPIAAIAAPFFLGLVADRYFATEKVLGVLHLLGGVVMFAVPQATGAPAAFILLLLVYNLCYMPTLGLANSLAFHHIQSQEQQFPLTACSARSGGSWLDCRSTSCWGQCSGAGPCRSKRLCRYTRRPPRASCLGSSPFRSRTHLRRAPGSGCRSAASLGSTRWRNSAIAHSTFSSPPRCCCASRSLPTTTSPRSSWGTPASPRFKRRSRSVRCPR